MGTCVIVTNMITRKKPGGYVYTVLLQVSIVFAVAVAKYTSHKADDSILMILSDFRNGSIQSEGYPNGYKPNAIDWWTVQLKEGDIYVLFELEQLGTYSVENERLCADNVTIYYSWNTTVANSSKNGNQETYCTNQNGWYYANGQRRQDADMKPYFANITREEQDFFRVLFVTDGQGQSDVGFKLNYAIYQDPKVPVQAPVEIPRDPGDRIFTVDDGDTGDSVQSEQSTEASSQTSQSTTQFSADAGAQTGASPKQASMYPVLCVICIFMLR